MCSWTRRQRVRSERGNGTLSRLPHLSVYQASSAKALGVRSKFSERWRRGASGGGECSNAACLLFYLLPALCWCGLGLVHPRTKRTVIWAWENRVSALTVTCVCTGTSQVRAVVHFEVLYIQDALKMYLYCCVALLLKFTVCSFLRAVSILWENYSEYIFCGFLIPRLS